uniref:LOW QUALITY PROTEIN: probable G-protein coupled receptor 158 n=1 Tax=Petromyzon marinus TaxID=7757 RepID=A0AAJ7WL72_PETMA|nr:LOW QUALITY PROTEIN: probable G-protein coupled receptor 158 [Petromyzon marinus]
MGHHHHHHHRYNCLHRHLQLLPLLLLSACSTVFVCAARGHGEGVVVFEPLLLGQESSPGGRGARLRDRERAGRPHSSSSSSSSPGQESAGLDPQTLAAIWLFFSTGDRIHLADARCTKRFELSVPGAATRGGGGAAGGGLTPAPDGAAEALAHYAHLLTAVLEQAGRERREEATVQHARWYPALLSSLLESDPRVRRALLAFDGAGDFLQVNRGSARGDIVLRNVSSLPADQSAKAALAACPGGLKSQQPPRGPRNQAGFAQGLREGRAATAARSRKGHAAERAHLVWSPPYLECEDGSYSPRWVQSLSACLQGPKDEQHALEFRGTLRLDLDLHGQEIDQCAEESAGWFAGTHRCHANSSQCVAVRGQGFRLGAYNCVCRTGFYRPRAHANDTGGARGGGGGGGGGGGFGTDGVGGVECAPCAEGCSTCTDGRPCLAVLLPALRLALLAAELLCALLVLASMAVVYRCRRNKNIRSSGLLLLEVLLFGSFLLCFPVIILYFEPGALQCMALRWVRLLGFSILYGTITLKLHRVLKVFLARTAQRLPYLTSGRVLRMLGIIMLLVLWFLTAWSAAAWENLGRGVLLVGVGQTAEGLRFTQCLLSRWDYMMALAEFLFLCWTMYLCYAVRTVPSAFHEPCHMTVAVLNEMLLSLIFHILQFVMTFTLHPDWMLLMVFIHTQLTVTVTVGLLLIPKFACSGATLRDDIAAEAYEDELDVMRRSGSYLNSSIASAWSEHSMDPEDLRDELKRLYAQLEVYKGQKMLSNNPHLQKKRSSKKGLGRSIMRRITELPENVVRQSSREERDRGGRRRRRRRPRGGRLGGSAHGPHTPGSCKRVAIAASAGVVAATGVAAAPSPTADAAKGGRAEQQQQQQRSSTATGTTNHKAFALPKSYSSYDHLLEQSEPSSASTSEKAEAEPLPGAGAGSGDGGVEASSPRDRSAPSSGLASGKEMSPDGEARGESESVDSAPLVCRSASAHNLSASDKRSPSSAVGKHHHHHHHHHHNQHQHHHHVLKPSLLQKSLSLISGARERTAALSGKVGVSEAKTDEAKVATTPVVAAVSEAVGRKDHVAQEETKTAKVPAAAATGMKRTVTVAAAAATAASEAKERVKASSLKSRQEESPRPQSPQTHHPQRNSSEERHGVTFADNTPRPEEEYNREEVCPWEFQGMASTPPPPVDPSRPQKHVSIAPQKHTSIAGARYHSLDSTQFAGKLPEVGRHRAALAPVRHQSLTEVVGGGGGGDGASRNGAAPETAAVAETKAPPPPPPPPAASSPEDGTKKLSPMAEAVKPVPAQAVAVPPQDKPAPAAPVVVAAVARADVCPWEVQPGEADEPGAEAGDGSARKPAANLGDICPWELEAEIPSSSSGRAVHGLTVSPTAAATMAPEAPASDRSPGGGKSEADSAHELAGPGHPKLPAKSLGSAFKSLVSGGKKRDKGGAERPNHPGGPGNDRVRAAAAPAAAQGTAKPREGDRSKR